ncbi:MAG: aminotransferase class V-fold PLP-dependent enzyme [Candidatus Bathyarchaeota archaeon]|nr:aminotransferase class V-fold PLP-dependent enzyme [Candidatus Bathyarchaeota archaeon]
MSVYETLGVRRVVNARGRMTLLGGSVLPEEVLEAMREANRCYVDMEELQNKAGEVIANLLRAEDACVTAGAFSALVLATAACMTRNDPELMDKLPFTEGVRNEVIIQRGLRTKYDRSVTVGGAKLVEVGNEAGSVPADIEAAINEKTAAIHFLAPGGRENTVSLEEVLQIAKRHGLPVIVDAAGQTVPPENLRKYVAIGADLVCYGAKYFDGPNSAGILCGRKDLMEAAKLQTFVCFESTKTRAFGRGMKLDRQEIVGTVVALKRWMAMDHKARLQAQHEKIERLVTKLNKIPGVNAVVAGERLGITTSASIHLDQELLGLTSKEIVDTVKNYNPSIWIGLREEAIVVNADTLVDGDEQAILESLKKAITRP